MLTGSVSASCSPSEGEPAETCLNQGTRARWGVLVD